MSQPLAPADFDAPKILLSGTVDYSMYQSFRDQLARSPVEGLTVVELSTLGGDPEVARMMGEDVRYHSDIQPGRRFVFLGKAAIYSAGTTFMSFFCRTNRYLTRGTRLASFFWIESMVREDSQRSLLLDMDAAVRTLAAEVGDDHRAIVALTGTYHNLLRRWADA